jgi:hypothetical protein
LFISSNKTGFEELQAARQQNNKKADELFNNLIMSGIIHLKYGLVLNPNPIICKYTEIRREFHPLIK